MSGVFSQPSAIKAPHPEAIPPSIGRVLHYWPSAEAKEAPGAQPLPVICCYVHSDTMLNVVAFNANGEPFTVTSITLRQPGDVEPKTGPFVEWMPYQIATAAGK